VLARDQLPASDTIGSPHILAEDVEVGDERSRSALDRLRNAIGAWRLHGVQPVRQRDSRLSDGVSLNRSWNNRSSWPGIQCLGVSTTSQYNRDTSRDPDSAL
jgi:hypothetical protein